MPCFYRCVQKRYLPRAGSCGRWTAEAGWTCQHRLRRGCVLSAACWCPEKCGGCDPEQGGKDELKVPNVPLSWTTGTSNTCFESCEGFTASCCRFPYRLRCQLEPNPTLSVELVFCLWNPHQAEGEGSVCFFLLSDIAGAFCVCRCSFNWRQTDE